MPFFFILPLWLLCLLAAAVLAAFPQTRRLGIWLAIISSCSVLASFLLSTAFMLAATRLPSSWSHSNWLGISFLVTYVLSILAGGAIGAAAGVYLSFKRFPFRFRADLASSATLKN